MYEVDENHIQGLYGLKKKQEEILSEQKREFT